MDASQAKAFELQAQVRHNAETYRNTLNDLYSWEKEIKDKEKELQKQRHLDGGDAESLKTLPIRSHVQQEQKQVIQEALKRATQQAKDGGAWGAETPTEKQDAEPDPVAVNRKQANECKDRGNMYVKLSDYTNALIEYTKAIELYPNEAIYYSNRALVYLRLERYDECIEDCNQALAIDSMSVKSYYRRMQANESLGNHMDALKDCTSALMIEPKNAEALRSLDRINERLRKHVKSTNTANFTPERPDLIDISPIEKPAYKRSNKPLKRIKIAEIVTSRADTTGGNLKISDEDIDKLFNSNCGPFVEVKKGDNKVETSEQQSPPKTTAEKVDKVAPKADKSTEELKPKSKLETTSEKATNETQPQAKPAALVKPQAATEKSSTVEIKSTEKTTAKRPLPSAPTSTAQFYSNWKELTPEQKYHYLKSINLADLNKVLGAGFSSDTLTDIINTLHDYYVPNEEPTTAATLLEVSKNNQIKILSMLMSTEDNTALSRILSSFAHNSNVPESIVKRILHNFNLP